MKLECSTQISTQLIEPGGSHPPNRTHKKTRRSGFNIWYDRVDSNHRPLPCQGSALTN